MPNYFTDNDDRRFQFIHLPLDEIIKLRENNFEESGETEEERIESRKRWFDVENYVKFMCDHMRSKIKNMVKSKTIEEFHADAINLVRDCILGESVEGDGRSGQSFENGMRIYEVEVLKVTIGDHEISSLLVDEQHVLACTAEW